ncbi:HAD-IA family hydrolase [Thermocoleostomius sinensis]|uniref:HAD-IA family hydrolase n=1 Tax=Thermocoleostomius sinensis A174 TaxID=2016057 RepID=A0A9E8ZB71_9CYAN|nr:HAD-IA family hydrolase [Thermocoleostomius sinensis]WAL58193.1 HAD-IA family hydrolase [Thermocoleostomius sinensis A174]
MSNLRLITHIIYDFDGLLLNTEPIHAQVNQTIAARYGKTFDATVRTKVMGRRAQDSAQVIIDVLSLPLTVEEYLAQKDAIIYDLYPAACPMPGAMELTRHFHQAQLPQAIASSSSRRPFQYKTLHYQDWLQLFDLIVLGDDPAIANGKPAPDIFLLAAERLGAVPAHCLVFEDSLAGLFAAKQAGMAVVAVPDPIMDKRLFQAADQVLNSLTEFNPQDWNLPL